MFTVCPKCALTLVVTAQDLRVAQGYVRCGRCSNVFNAIVGLTDDRGALAASQGTASTSIMRKAPSISDDLPATPQDTLNDTGESEAVYAEPDADEVKFQEVFAEPAPQTRSPARTPPPTPAPTPDTRSPGAVSFSAPPPGPPAKAPPSATQARKALEAEKRYSDTEGIETYPESELEFNPAVTDVTKVFVEAAPVTFKGDATGKFRKFVMGEEQVDPTEPPPAARAPAPPSGARQPASASASAQARSSASAPNGRSTTGAAASNAQAASEGGRPTPAANGAAANARSQPAGSPARPAGGGSVNSGATGSFATGSGAGGRNAGASSAAGNAATTSAMGANANTNVTGTFATGANANINATGTFANGANASNGAAGAKPGAPRSSASGGQGPATRTPSAPIPPPPPADEDDDDFQINDDLRALAARIDVTSTRPVPKFPAAAANDEGLDNDGDDDGGGLGDIYAKAVPRPRPPPPPPAPPPSRATPPTRRAQRDTYVEDSDDDFSTDLGPDVDAEMQAVDSAIDTFTPAAPPRSRFTWWIAGAAVLSVLLVGQVIHQNRHSLATNALLNRPLTKFYKAIGVSLVPSWDLRSYDVRQLGASTNDGGDGTLTVRASLKNNSAQPLPLPLLRITMQDRYGNRIATRDVSPSGYVPGAVPAEAHLGAGQRIDAEMTFKDPGQNAVGFEIDACLATASGRIACANDQAAAPR